MSNHTKGKWNQIGTSVGITDGEICVCYTNGLQFDALANARLIAAAPDLLEACIKAEHNGLDLPVYVRELLADAISKATGEQND